MIGWHDPFNAEKYDDFTQTQAMYRVTSVDLVRFAGISPGMRVIDVACGTGVTTRAVLDVIGTNGKIYAVDMSAAMLEKARQNAGAENVVFVQSEAETLDKALTENVNAVVCNSAFWQMQGEETLQAIRRILAPDGVFAFNLPESFYMAARPPETPTTDTDVPRANNFSLNELLRRIATEKFNVRFEGQNARQKPFEPYTYEDIVAMLERSGYRLETQQTIGYEQTADALRAWWTIPVMSEHLLPGVDYDTRMKVFDEAFSTIPNSGAMKREWTYFLAKLR